MHQALKGLLDPQYAGNIHTVGLLREIRHSSWQLLVLPQLMTTTGGPQKAGQTAQSPAIAAQHLNTCQPSGKPVGASHQQRAIAEASAATGDKSHSIFCATHRPPAGVHLCCCTQVPGCRCGPQRQPGTQKAAILPASFTCGTRRTCILRHSRSSRRTCSQMESLQARFHSRWGQLT
jgi:hypothetical protein